MKRDRRITLRLDKEQWDSIQALCQSSGLDVSGAVRSALRAARAPGNSLPAAQGARKPFFIPDRILNKVQPYLAWGKGNLKDERNRQFDECFALTLACKQLFPRTPGIAECLAQFVDIEQRFPRES
jgi:hypothetical protein